LGELQQKFEQLKQRLYAEGLFAEKHKKAIPSYPQCIGIITSPTGAAIKDIISILRRRAPSKELLIYGVKVQGDGAAAEIVNAIKAMNTHGKVDVLILGRGGGSLEDLWPFNEEVVARAIFESEIPLISAVGHEIDFTIADFVSDLRAPTPSAAAELAVKDENELKDRLLKTEQYLFNTTMERLSKLRSDILNIRNRYAFKKPEDLIGQYSMRLDEISNRLYLAGNKCIDSYKESVIYLSGKLNSLNPVQVLQRGYSMLFKDGALVKSVNDVDIDDSILTKLSDGNINSLVTKKS
jgi:exodeoxyribonuclease VII large subunit